MAALARGSQGSQPLWVSEAHFLAAAAAAFAALMGLLRPKGDPEMKLERPGNETEETKNETRET